MAPSKRYINQEEAKPLSFYTNKIVQSLRLESDSQYYIQNPAEYLEFFGRPWEKQIDIIKSVRDNPVTLVRSANATGKTFTAAAVALWFLDNYKYDCKVVTTAKTNMSLKYTFWAQIRKQYIKVKDRFNYAPINLSDFSPDPQNYPDWYMIGLNPKIEGTEATAFQGHHARHLLFIIDEAVTTHPAIFEAMEGSLMAGNAKLLAIWNPTVKTGNVYKWEKEGFGKLISISVWDLFRSSIYQEHTEDFVSLANPAAVENLIEKYGKNHAIVRARADGDYPDEDENSAVKYSEFVECQENISNYEEELKKTIWTKVIFSWDVADDGTDSNTLSRLREGFYFDSDDKKVKINESSFLKEWHGKPKENLEFVRDTIKEEMESEIYECQTETVKKLIEKQQKKQAVTDLLIDDIDFEDDEFLVELCIIIDSVGVGSFAGSYLEEDFPAAEVIRFKGGGGSMKDINVENYEDVTILNNNSEAWFYTDKLIEGKHKKEWGILCIDCDDKTLEEVTTRQKNWGIKNKEPMVYFIEPKDDYKDRTSSGSPDHGDALVMSIFAKFNHGERLLQPFSG